MPKSKSVKKIVKNNKKKKFDFKKQWKQLSFVALAGFLLFGSVGYALYDRFREDEASAANSTLIGTVGSVTLRACKRQDIRRVTFFATNNATTSRSVNLQMPALVGSRILSTRQGWTSSYTWNSGYSSVNVGGYIKTVGSQSSTIGSYRSISTNNLVTC